MENNSEIKFTFVTENLIKELQRFTNEVLGYDVYSSLPGEASKQKGLELARLLDDFIIEKVKADMSQETDPGRVSTLQAELDNYQTVLIEESKGLDSLDFDASLN